MIQFWILLPEHSSDHVRCTAGYCTQGWLPKCLSPGDSWYWDTSSFHRAKQLFAPFCDDLLNNSALKRSFFFLIIFCTIHSLHRYEGLSQANPCARCFEQSSESKYAFIWLTVLGGHGKSVRRIGKVWNAFGWSCG